MELTIGTKTAKKVREIVNMSFPYRGTDDAKCEEILREGLKKYPGNDVLLKCLIYSIPVPERSDEVITNALPTIISQ